jgi:hypothetical protein
LIPLLFLVSVARAQNSGEERIWTDNTGQNTLAARFLSYDKENDQVVLLTSNNETKTLSLSDFSRADQRLIRKFAAQAQRAENANPKRDAIDDALTGQASSSTANGERNPNRLNGIDWFVSAESASTAATASERPDDDRPIAWFRVLGELDGFM